MTRRTGRQGAQKSQAKYDAAGQGRRIKAWNPPTTGPQRAIEGVQRIRDRARDSTRNDWAGASSVQKWATNLIGVGITPRWKSAALTALWKSHVPLADADGVLDAYGMQTLGVRSWFDSGEVFLRRRPRALSLPLAVPVQYQLIEADYVPMLDTDSWPGLPVGNTIRQGIERNIYGRRTAYWMYLDHPGDKPMRPVAGQLIRVLASDVSHVFEPKRPGQLRGVSELASVLVRLRSSMDFEDAVLDRQKLANLFVAFITRAMPASEDLDFNPDTGLPKFYDSNGTSMVGLEPGITQELQPGEGVTFANPPEAGTTYSEYMRSTHIGTAAGSGLPYEIMSGDIQNVSDRTLRVVINEFRRLARQRQWQIVIPMLCQPMVDWWADAAVLSGSLSMADLAEAKAPKWSPEGWEYIHPVQDITGKQLAIEAGIMSRSGVISERGDDPTEVDAERADDKKREDKLGLTPVVVAPAAPAPVAPPKPPAKPTAVEHAQIQAYEAQTLLSTAQTLRMSAPAPEANAMEHFIAGLATLNASVVALAARPAAVINVEPSPLTVAAPQITLGDVHVVNEVAPTPITVEVDVAAPAVTVTNEVQPAAVAVTVELPDRQTTSVIDRDKAGNIIEVTQTETTLLQ